MVKIFSFYCDNDSLFVKKWNITVKHLKTNNFLNSRNFKNKQSIYKSNGKKDVKLVENLTIKHLVF